MSYQTIFNKFNKYQIPIVNVIEDFNGVVYCENKHFFLNT